MRAIVAPPSTQAVQRLLEVGDQVLHVLQPDREAHQPVGDAHGRAHLGPCLPEDGGRHRENLIIID